MRTAPPDFHKDAGQGLAKVLTLSLTGAAVAAYLALRFTGLLTGPSQPQGMGTPLNAMPYFAQPPALSPAYASLSRSSTDPATVNADKMLLPVQQKAALESAKSYLRMLEHAEAAKQTLLQTAVIRFPRLRLALMQAGAARADALSLDTRLGAPERLLDSDDFARIAWDRMISDFELLTPPTNCIELHASYTAHLKALRDYIVTCLQADATRTEDKDRTGEASPLSGKQQAQACLRAETNVTAEALQDLCAHYGLTPDVEITVTVR